MKVKAVLRSFLVVAVCVGTMMSAIPARAQQPQNAGPVSAKLSLQSGLQPGAEGRNRIPMSRSDPAYTVGKLDIAPAIYLDVTFANGSKAGPDYKKNFAQNIIFDDTSGDPHDIIKVVYWDVDSKNPQLGKYAAQLTSTGKGVGTASLKVSFRNAPGVTASVPVEVVSAAQSPQQPLVSSAQPTNELTLLEQAIKNYVSSDSGITQGVQVKNIKIEGMSASASVSAEGADSAMVFMKKSSGTWVGIFIGTGLGPGECESMGFSSTSKICPR